MKKLYLILAVVLLYFGAISVQADSVTLVYRGTANPGELISFLITDTDADYSNMTAENIIKTEVVEAGADGSFVWQTELSDAVLDENGLIINYKLKSNYPGFDINSGIATYRVTIPGAIVYDDVVYVPIKKTLDELDIEYTYDLSALTYAGKSVSGEVILTVGEYTAEIDWVDVELPAPIMQIGGMDMMPMYILEDMAKTTSLSYDKETSTVTAECLRNENSQGEFDIKSILDTLPDGEEFLTQSELCMNIKGADGLQYLTITQAANNTLVLETNFNEFGEIQDRIQAIKRIYGKTFNKGEVGLVSFKARATKIEDESGNAMATVVFENEDTWEKALNEQINIHSGDWQEFYLPVYNPYTDITAGSRFIFDVGGRKPQTIEIKDLLFVNYGTSVDIETLRPSDSQPYKGMEEDHIWRKEAYRRIEKYRKEDMVITATDAQGNPVEGAIIDINMTDNEFMFGVALCDNEVVDLDTSTKGGRILDSLIDNDFNTGVCGLEMKMGYVLDDGGVDGIRSANEFFSRGKRMRGHALYWDEEGEAGLDDFENLTYDEIYRRVMDHIRPTVYAYKGRLEHWDVINEPYDSHHTRVNFDTTRLYSDMFKEVKKIDPDVKVFVNETGIEGKADKNSIDRIPGFLDIVKRIQKEGAQVDGIGIQAHCQSYLYPQGFYHQLDECAQIVDEVAVTEYDFRNINSDYADEHLRDTLLATFSHPKATAFVVWGVEDSMHWRGEGSFYNSNWEEKPALAVWRSMVNEEFATHETLTTDAEGRVTLRGFRGDYEIKCTVNGITGTADFKLVKDGENTVDFTVNSSSVSADVSNEPYVNTEPLEFASVDEARKEYEQLNPVTYTGILIDANFKGCESVTTVTNGAYFSSNVAFLSGEAWATANGSKNLLSGGDALSTILKSSGTFATVDLRRHVRNAYRDEKTDVYFETMFDTMSSTASGTMNVLLMVGGMNSGSSIVYSNGSYYVELGNGTQMPLDANSEYSFKIIYEGSKVNYELYKSGNLIDSHTAATALEANKSNEIGYYITTDIQTESNIFKLYNARFCAYKNREIINFMPCDLNVYEVDDTMMDTDLWQSTGNEDAFEYVSYGRYLYSMMKSNGNGELKRSFKPIEIGETLTFSYTMRINADYGWMSSANTASIQLGSADGTVNLIAAQFGGDQYNGYKLDLLKLGTESALSTKVQNGYTTQWNWRDLTFNVTLSPNGSGAYTAGISVYDADNNLVYTYNLSSVLTEQEAASIDTITIKSSTKTVSKSDKKLCGFKNIRIEKSGRSLGIADDGKTLLQNSEKLGIKFDNSLTFGTHEAKLITAAYKGNALVWVKSTMFTIDSENGSINFELDKGEDDIDCFKVFLFKGDTIVPYKASDKIYINQVNR